MEKLINKNLIFSLLLLVIFAFTLAMPITTKAETIWGTPGGGTGGHAGSFGNSFSYNNQNNYNNSSPNINYAPANNPVPVIYAISPSSATQCSGATTLVVNGANFVQNSIVRWNGSNKVTTPVSSTRLIAELTDADICGSGNYLVTVSNPNPGGGISNPASFAINKRTVTPVTTTTTTTKKPTIAAKKTTTTKTVDNSAISCDTSATIDTSATETTNETDATSEDNTSLTGSAIFGSGSFMPTTLAQWLLLFTLILLAIVLFRKLYAKKFRTEPLKHA